MCNSIFNTIVRNLIYVDIMLLEFWNFTMDKSGKAGNFVFMECWDPCFELEFRFIFYSNWNKASSSPYAHLLLHTPQVQVSFYNPKGTCGESTNPSQPARRTVHVEGFNSQSLKFVIVPVELGDLPITVTATSDVGSDGVQKILNVIVST